MYRTPARKAMVFTDSSPEEPPRATVAQARRSFEPQPDGPSSRPAEHARQMPRAKTVYKNRMTEAAALLAKIKMSINASRNIKTDIKNDVLESAQRMWQLVKDAEEGRKHKKSEETKETQTQIEYGKVTETDIDAKNKKEEAEKTLTNKLEEHLKVLAETKEYMEKVKDEICKQRQEVVESRSYASAVAGSPKAKSTQAVTALHSIVVTSKDELETGEEVVERIRKAIRAKEEGLRIDKMRKAKDRKVIIGVQNDRELEKIKENLKKNGKDLKFEDIKNKDPLVILKDVMSCHSDDDIVSAIKSQNKHLLESIDCKEIRMEVKHRRRARNALLAHIILRVSPKVWRQLTDAGAVFVDVQRVRVEDQSPVVQCSKCLGYGHGRRFCRAPQDVCSHCGGSHKKAECADWQAAEKPICCNCQRASLPDVGHNAFSSDCPVKKKWEVLARSSIAYC